MKKRMLKVGIGIGALAAAFGLSTQAQAHAKTHEQFKAEIANITEETPLYLDQAPTYDARSEMVLAWHTSHASHASHSSHYSHYSSYR